MKKLLLSVGLAFAAISSVSAANVTFNAALLPQGGEFYGIDASKYNAASALMPEGTRLYNGPVSMTFSTNPTSGDGGWYFDINTRKYGIVTKLNNYKVATDDGEKTVLGNNLITFTVNGGKINSITAQMTLPLSSDTSGSVFIGDSEMEKHVIEKDTTVANEVIINPESDYYLRYTAPEGGVSSVVLSSNYNASIEFVTITVNYTPGELVAPAIPSALDITSVAGTFERNDCDGWQYYVGNLLSKEGTSIINVPTPAGWDCVYVVDLGELVAPTAASDWLDPKTATSFVKENEIEVPMDGKLHTYGVYLGAAGQIYLGWHAEIQVQADRTVADAKDEEFLFTGLTVGQEYFGGIKCVSNQNIFMDLPATLKQGDVEIVLTQEGPDTSIVGSSTWSLNAASSANYQGLYMKKMNGISNYHVATISVPGCKITDVKISYSKNITSSYEGTISMTDGDGHEVALTDGSKAATSSATDLTLAWSNEKGSDKVMLKSNYQSFEAYKTIKVTYKPAGDEENTPKDSGLAFAEKYYSVYKGEAFESPVLENPNGLPVKWKSSDVKVAYVNSNGIVTVKGVGVATISATSEATDEFKAGNASYLLTVNAAAYSFKDLEDIASANAEKCYVNFPMTITYSDGETAWAIDDMGNGGRLNLKNVYAQNVENIVAGNVIPKGWDATCYPMYGIPSYVGAFPAADGTAELSFESISEAPTIEQKNKLVYLDYVTFDKATPGDPQTQFTGRIADEEIDFITCSVAEYVKAQKKGTYRVLAAIGNYDERGGYFDADTIIGIKAMPIEFIAANDKVMAPKTLTVTSNVQDMEVSAPDADGIVNINVRFTDADVAEDKVVLTLAIPEGYDAIYHSPVGDYNIGGQDELLSAQPQFAQLVEDWIPVANLVAEGYVEGNVIELPTATSASPVGIYAFPAQGDKVANIAPYMFSVQVDNTVSVANIEAVDADADYYTLQGVKVANPAAGLYIKVANGKALKVLVK